MTADDIRAMRDALEKRGGLPTLAMSPGAAKKHLTRLGAFARKGMGMSREHVQATNKSMLAFRPKDLPAHVPAHASQAPVTRVGKKTPTQAIDAMALPRHLAKTNPEHAIQAGVQHKARVVGNASVLDQLQRTSFDKLSEYEKMDREKWKQTAIDLPLVILAGGIGHGVGKTISDYMGQRLAQKGVQINPMARSAVPLAMTAAGAAGGYLFGRARESMRQRREDASKKAGVEPAPQSRSIPRKKPSDPWRYDPRPAGIFGP
jgi:hypothetical protein